MLTEIPLESELYPSLLSSIQHPPKILYAKGNLDLLKTELSVAIVGSRDASDWGLRATEKITAHFVEKGHVIVSGLARGIDTAAHKAALHHYGQTIAVLPSGFDKIHPRENQPLAESIIEKGGLLVSEYPPSTSPLRQHFAQRNRIQVGLSQFSIVVESIIKSGTMIHANFCMQEKHPLYVVLPEEERANEKNFEGNLWLYEQKNGLPLRSKMDYPG